MMFQQSSALFILAGIIVSAKLGRAEIELRVESEYMENGTVTVPENDEVAAPEWSVTFIGSKDNVTALTFAVESEFPGHDVFAMDHMCIGTSCDLKLTSIGKLDFDTGDQVAWAVVKVTDPLDPFDSNQVNLSMSVEDLNDETPVINNGSLSMNIAENQEPGTLIGQVEATDADAGDSLTYGISGRDAHQLQINSTNGKLYSQASFVKEDSPISAKVNVTDSDGKSATGNIEVTVGTERDNNPICTPPVVRAQVPENSVIGTHVATVNCTDAAEEGIDLDFAIESGDDFLLKFIIETPTGKITTTENPLDYETKANYSLSIRVAEPAHPERNTTATVLVEVIQEQRPPMPLEC